jgi:hypothetical protein
MYPHRIRLRGPWECEPLHSDVRPFRATMPCRWDATPLAGRTGTVRCRRRFGYPGRLDGDERVWLTIADRGPIANVAVNGVALAARQTTPCEFDVTSLLAARNELVMDVETADDWGEVALEVRATAFLTGVGLRSEDDHLVITGEIAGAAERPLELYVLFDGRHVHYTTAPAGRPFVLSVECPPGFKPAVVQVDLVNGAVVWYTVSIAPPSLPAARE